MSLIHNMKSCRRKHFTEKTNYTDIFLLREASMFVVCGMENVQVTHQPWEENYHGASFLEVFPVGGKILENLWKWGKEVDRVKVYSKNNKSHEWKYKWEKHRRGQGRRWEWRGSSGFLAPPHLLCDNLKSLKSGGWEGHGGNSIGHLGKPLNGILRVWAKKHKR